MITAFAACVLWLSALPGDDVLQRAERAYRDGHYAQAHELWVAALQDPQLAKGQLMFNLGNCAYRMGQVPEAVLWWQRARLRAPRDPEIAFNLRRGEQELGLAEDPRAWGELLTRRELWALVIALQAAGLLAIALGRRPAVRLGGAVLALATLPAAVGLADSTPRARATAIVLARSAVLRAEPHAEVPRVAPLAAGTRVWVLAASDRWVCAEAAGERGWIERAQIGLVE